MDTFNSIKVFRQIVESGSFVGAAERLDVSTAMVSKHLMQLEQRLGVRLLNRNNRRLSLTEPGKVYFERCSSVLDELERTEQELGSLGTVPRGTLRITAPSSASSQSLARLFAEYRRQYPEVVLDVSFEDRFVDLVEEGYDLGLRVVSSRDVLPANLVARPVRPLTFYLAASCEYVSRRGMPKSPQDLSQHDFVAVGNANSVPLTGPTGKIEVPVHVVMRYRSMRAVANAIAASIGIAPIPATLFDEPAFQDVLVPILPEWHFTDATLYFVYSSRKFVSSAVRTFIDFTVESLSRMPEPDPASPRRAFCDGFAPKEQPSRRGRNGLIDPAELVHENGSAGARSTGRIGAFT